MALVNSLIQTTHTVVELVVASGPPSYSSTILHVSIYKQYFSCNVMFQNMALCGSFVPQLFSQRDGYFQEKTEIGSSLQIHGQAYLFCSFPL